MLAALPEEGPEFYIAACNMRHGRPRVGSCGPLPKDVTLVDRMDRKVSNTVGRRLYDKRKWMIEPVFGQIKTGQGIRGFARRGFAQAGVGWKLIALTHNLRKLHRHVLTSSVGVGDRGHGVAVAGRACVAVRERYGASSASVDLVRGSSGMIEIVLPPYRCRVSASGLRTSTQQARESGDFQ